MRSGVCIALHPKDACSRGEQAGCERGLSFKSRLCVVNRALLATLRGGSLGVWWLCVVSGRVLVVSPGSPFIVSRGAQVLTYVIGVFSAEW